MKSQLQRSRIKYKTVALGNKEQTTTTTKSSLNGYVATTGGVHEFGLNYRIPVVQPSVKGMSSVMFDCSRQGALQQMYV